MYIKFLGNTDVFEVLSCIVTLIITLRALWLYARLRGSRILILGLAMGLFSLTTIAEMVNNMHFVPVPFNTAWFSFVGQTEAFFFVFLGAIRASDSYLRNVVRWQLVLSALIVSLLFLATLLPDVTSALLKALFIGARALVCLFVFYRYIILFTRKGTRFGLFMGGAFFCLTMGYLFIIPRFYLSNVDILTMGGDILRVIGLVLLAVALLGG